MCLKRAVAFLAVLFLTSQISCEANIKRTLDRAVNRHLRRSLKHYGVRLRGRQTLTVEPKHALTDVPLSAAETPFVQKKDATVDRKLEEIVCLWDESTGKCETSQQAEVTLLAASNNAFAQFVTQFTSCKEAEDELSCTSTGKCLWRGDEGRCYFFNITSGQEDSSCYKAAPGFVDIMTYSPLCDAASSQQACDEAIHCSWDEDDRECVVDMFQLLCGVSIADLSQAMDRMYSNETFLSSDLTKTVGIVGPEFDDWDGILKWKPSKMECPDDVDPRVWDVLYAQMLRIAPVIFYCTRKYDGPEYDKECDQDLLCERKAFEYGCSMNESDLQAVIGFVEDMLPLVDGELDRHILESFTECELLDRKKCKGKCIWNWTDRECVPKEDWVMREIVGAGKDEDDALCKYFAAEVQSGCHRNYGEKKCSKKQQCTWQSFDEVCTATTAYLFKAARDTDPTKNRSIDTLSRQCQAQTTKRDCLDVRQMTAT